MLGGGGFRRGRKEYLPVAWLIKRRKGEGVWKFSRTEAKSAPLERSSKNRPNERVAFGMVITPWGAC